MLPILWEDLLVYFFVLLLPNTSLESIYAFKFIEYLEKYLYLTHQQKNLRIELKS